MPLYMVIYNWNVLLALIISGILIAHIPTALAFCIHIGTLATRCRFISNFPSLHHIHYSKSYWTDLLQTIIGKLAILTRVRQNDTHGIGNAYIL